MINEKIVLDSAKLRPRDKLVTIESTNETASCVQLDACESPGNKWAVIQALELRPEESTATENMERSPPLPQSWTISKGQRSAPAHGESSKQTAWRHAAPERNVEIL